jgi:hypothetical protein
MHVGAPLALAVHEEIDMKNVAFRGDWFDAGIGVELLDFERLSESVGIEIEHAIASALERAGLPSAATLCTWVVGRLRRLRSNLRA